MAAAVRVKGLRELDRALRRVGSDVSPELRRSLKEAADIVADDARSRFEHYSPSSAGTMEGKAYARGAVVQQTQGRTTGKRPDFGSLQMRWAFLPALASKAAEVVRRVERMLDELGRRNGF